MPAQLDDRTYELVTLLSDSGNKHMDDGEYEKALENFRAAFNVLPKPEMDWDAGEWLAVSIADALFSLQRFAEAKEWLFEARQDEDAAANAFINLRLGQTLLELGEENAATEYLLRAYMVKEEEIFEDEEPKYLEHLIKKGLVS